MKDENTQVPDTFDEQEELRSEKRGLRLYFSGLVCCLIAFGFIIAGIFFQKYNVKNGDAIAIGGYLWYRSSFSYCEKYRLCSAVGSRP